MNVIAHEDWSQTANHHACASPFESARLLRVLLAAAVFLNSWRVIRAEAMNVTLADVLFMGTALLLLARGRLQGAPFGQPGVIYTFGLIGMLGGLLVGTVVNGDPIRWAIAASQYLFTYIVIPMILASFSQDWLRRCITLFVIGVAVSQLVGAAAALHPAGEALVDVFGQGFITGNGRIGALTGEPNPNGAMCAMGMILTLNGLQQGTMRWKVALCCGAALALGILQSASFTAFAAVSVCSLFMLAASGLRALARIGLPIVLFAGAYVAAGSPLPAAFQERVAGAIVNGNPDEAGTYVGRSALISEAWARAEHTMVVGLGVDRYRVESAYGAPVHNLHLLILNEGGAIAYLGLLTMIGLLTALSIMIYRHDRKDGAMCLSLMGVFLVYTMAIPHMYDRIWITPVLLAIIACQKWREPALAWPHPPRAFLSPAGGSVPSGAAS